MAERSICFVSIYMDQGRPLQKAESSIRQGGNRGITQKRIIMSADRCEQRFLKLGGRLVPSLRAHVQSFDDQTVPLKVVDHLLPG